MEKIKNDINRIKERTIRAFEDNPLATMGAIGLVFTGSAKLIESVSGVQSKRAYAKRMNRNDRRDNRRNR